MNLRLPNLSRKKRETRNRKRVKPRRLSLQPLENRRVLAASLGWDGPGLGSAELTYTISGSPDSLTQAETNAAIESAFAAWSSAADITFTPANQTGLHDSIDISFINIDGRARTLAQAYFPDDVNPNRIAGDIQFDISESWEVGNSLGNRAFDLVWVAVHEIGHSLGLDHPESEDLVSVGSVLAPFVSPNQSFSVLASVDVAAIQSVYASADAEPITPDASSDNPENDVERTEPNDVPTPENESDTDIGDRDSERSPRRRWRRSGNWHRFGGRLDAETLDMNYVSPTDVNGDNQTSALDALMIINQINRSAASNAEDASDHELAALCDVNGDGAITAIDALTVINTMNLGDLAEADASNETADDASDLLEDDELVEDGDMSSNDESLDDEESADDEEMIDDGGMIDTGDTPEMEDDVTEPPLDPTTPTDHRRRHHSRGFAIGILRGDPQSFVMRFDTNEDGSVTEDEVPARLWTKLESSSIDLDADDILTLDELTEAVDNARQASFDAKDSNGDGFLTEEEVSDRFWAKLSTADGDADQSISTEEFVSFIETRQAERASRDDDKTGDAIQRH